MFDSSMWRRGLCVLCCVWLGLIGVGTVWAAPGTPPEKARVLATTFPVWLMTRQAAEGTDLDVELMLPARAGCPHDYVLTPQDMRRLASADVLIINGLGMENFLGDQATLRARLKPGAILVDSSAGLSELLPEDGEHGHEHEAAGALTEEPRQPGEKGGRAGHVGEAGAFNPHLFTSPHMAAAQTRRIGEALAGIFPARAEVLRRGAAKYAAELDALADECAALKPKLEGRVILTQHDAFDYLARDLGLVTAGRIRLREGAEPSAADLRRLVGLIQGKKVEAIIVEPQYPDRAGRALSRETGVPCVELDPGAQGSDHPEADCYAQVTRANLRALEAVLGAR